MGILQDIGSYSYFCPHCRKELNKEIGIEFKVQAENKKNYYIYLDPTLGKYAYTYDYSSIFKKGEKVEFYCTHCDNNLESAKHPDYVEIIMSVSEDVEFEILFSRIYGTKKTYLIDENYSEAFGIDSDENELSLLKLG